MGGTRSDQKPSSGAEGGSAMGADVLRFGFGRGIRLYMGQLPTIPEDAPIVFESDLRPMVVAPSPGSFGCILSPLYTPEGAEYEGGMNWGDFEFDDSDSDPPGLSPICVTPQ